MDFDEVDFDYTNYTIDHCCLITDVPKTYKQALSSADFNLWKFAMDEEVKKLLAKDTYEIVDLPYGEKVVPGRWVYVLKDNTMGKLPHHARWCAKGFHQEQGVNYGETFAPTAKMTTIHMSASVTTQDSMVTGQMDVNSAYLNADIDCDIYMEQPKGYAEDPNKVCKLKKAIYGLKQSGRQWNKLLTECLTKDGFTKSEADPCLFTKVNENGKVILIVWVDDIIISASNYDLLNDVKTFLSNSFQMKDLGPWNMFLGIEFIVSQNSISMNQSKYIQNILNRFGMSDCKPKSVPVDPSVYDLVQTESELLNDPTPYREIVGSLIYLMTSTRPDIAYVVTLLSQYMSSPHVVHLTLAKSVLRYIKGTINYNLKYVKTDKPLELIGFSDSDWGSSPDRHSISGYGFKLNTESALISWRSCKQRVVALSTCEAEYLALTESCKEALFLRQLLSDMTNSKKTHVKLHTDNQGSMALAKNPVHHKRTKHISIRYHFIRHQVLKGVIELSYIPTNDNIADLFTKPLPKQKFNQFCTIRGMGFEEKS